MPNLEVKLPHRYVRIGVKHSIYWVGNAHGFKHQWGSWNAFVADKEGLLSFYFQETECLTNCYMSNVTRSPKEGGGGSSVRSSFKADLSLILLLFLSWSHDWGCIQFQASHNYIQWLKARAPQGHSPSLAIIKEKKYFPEPLSKLLLTYHWSEAGHMPTLGLEVGIVLLRKKEGMASSG